MGRAKTDRLSDMTGVVELRERIMSSHFWNKPEESRHGGRGSLGWCTKTCLGAISRGSLTFLMNANKSFNNADP